MVVKEIYDEEQILCNNDDVIFNTKIDASNYDELDDFLKSYGYMKS